MGHSLTLAQFSPVQGLGYHTLNASSVPIYDQGDVISHSFLCTSEYGGPRVSLLHPTSILILIYDTHTHTYIAIYTIGNKFSRGSVPSTFFFKIAKSYIFQVFYKFSQNLGQKYGRFSVCIYNLGFASRPWQWQVYFYFSTNFPFNFSLEISRIRGSLPVLGPGKSTSGAALHRH